jgi:hypothetical protein
VAFHKNFCQKTTTPTILNKSPTHRFSTPHSSNLNPTNREKQIKKIKPHQVNLSPTKKKKPQIYKTIFGVLKKRSYLCY